MLLPSVFLPGSNWVLQSWIRMPTIKFVDALHFRIFSMCQRTQNKGFSKNRWTVSPVFGTYLLIRRWFLILEVIVKSFVMQFQSQSWRSVMNINALAMCSVGTNPFIFVAAGYNRRLSDEKSCYCIWSSLNNFYAFHNHLRSSWTHLVNVASTWWVPLKGKPSTGSKKTGEQQPKQTV